MRHQDQQQTHSLNLDMNFLDTKKKLIRIESHVFFNFHIILAAQILISNSSVGIVRGSPMYIRSTPGSKIHACKSVIQKRMKMNYGLVHSAITNQ